MSMNRKFYWIGYILGVYFVTVGCGASLMEIKNSSMAPVNGKEILEVAQFTNEANAPRDEVEFMRVELIERAGQEELFARVLPMVSSEENVLLLETNVKQFDPGDKFVRWLIPFGMGLATGKVSLDLKLRIKKNGDVLAEGTAYGSVWGGMFGGPMQSAEKRAVNGIINFLKENMAKVGGLK